MLATWIIFIIQALLSHLFFIYSGIEGLPVLVVVITTFFLIFDLSQYDFPKEVFLILFLTYFLRLFLLFFVLYGRDYFVLLNIGLDSVMFIQSAIIVFACGNYGNGLVYSIVIGFFILFYVYVRDYFVLTNSGLYSEMFNQSAITGLASGNYGNGHVYSIVIGFLYSFFGYERIIPQFFNVLLSVQTIILVYKTMGLYNIHK